MLDTRIGSRPLVAIGLDAFEPTELERRLADGSLPNLARLTGNGGVQHMRPDAAGFGGMSWRSFVNGLPVGEHGWYFSKVWRPDTGRIELATTEFLRMQPFWQPLVDAGMRLGLIDVPHGPDPDAAFDGVYLNGWQTHDVEPLRSSPPNLLGEIEERFGAPILLPERYGPQQPSDLVAMHANVLAATRQMSEIVEWLLKREHFDFFMVVLGATHRAGHYLWDLSQIDRNRLTPEERTRLEGSMDDVYAACDEAVGRIAAAAPDAAVMAFSPHGMGANTGWNDVIADLLHGLERNGETTTTHRAGLRDHLNAFRRSPIALKASRHMPRRLRGAVAKAWSSKMHDWSRTRYFSLPNEVVGMIRLNLEGREPAGIVPPEDYPALCEELVWRMSELRDVETGEPIVSKAHITDHSVPHNAEFRRYLPDVVVEWGERRVTDSIGVRLPGGRDLRWQRGRRISSGRSGDHRQYGWATGGMVFDTPINAPPTTVALARSFQARANQNRVQAAPLHEYA